MKKAIIFSQIIKSIWQLSDKVVVKTPEARFVAPKFLKLVDGADVSTFDYVLEQRENSQSFVLPILDCYVN